MENRISGLRKAGIIAVGGLVGLVGITSLTGCAKQEYVAMNRDLLNYGLNVWVNEPDGIKKAVVENMADGTEYDITERLIGKEKGRTNYAEGDISLSLYFDEIPELSKEDKYRLKVIDKKGHVMTKQEFTSFLD